MSAQDGRVGDSTVMSTDISHEYGQHSHEYGHSVVAQRRNDYDWLVSTIG